MPAVSSPARRQCCPVEERAFYPSLCLVVLRHSSPTLETCHRLLKTMCESPIGMTKMLTRHQAQPDSLPHPSRVFPTWADKIADLGQARDPCGKGEGGGVSACP